MPKKEINYQNTIIYKIRCKDLNIKDVYVGHTTNFIQRKIAISRIQIQIHTAPKYTIPLTKTGDGKIGI